MAMEEEEAPDLDVAGGPEMVPLEISPHGKDLDGYMVPVLAGPSVIRIGHHKTSHKVSLPIQNAESWKINKKCFSRILSQSRKP